MSKKNSEELSFIGIVAAFLIGGLVSAIFREVYLGHSVGEAGSIVGERFGSLVVMILIFGVAIAVAVALVSIAIVAAVMGWTWIGKLWRE